MEKMIITTLTVFFVGFWIEAFRNSILDGDVSKFLIETVIRMITASIVSYVFIKLGFFRDLR